MGFTELELSGMDYEILFKKDDKIVVITTNGCIEDKFFVDEDAQEALFDFIYNQETKSEWNIIPEMKKVYPDCSSFTDMAELGLYVYDMHNNVETLVVEPTRPLLVSDLPEELQNLLTEF